MQPPPPALTGDGGRSPLPFASGIALSDVDIDVGVDVDVDAGVGVGKGVGEGMTGLPTMLSEP
jgi:hypothetical protein